jgi:hypothetical protein
MDNYYFFSYYFGISKPLIIFNLNIINQSLISIIMTLNHTFLNLIFYKNQHKF